MRYRGENDLKKVRLKTLYNSQKILRAESECQIEMRAKFRLNELKYRNINYKY